MSTYSLIEYKLRRYVFLGHEYNMYVPPQTRHLFWQRKHHDNVTGVRIIGKIVNKNKTEEINSIVPALLKVCAVIFKLKVSMHYIQLFVNRLNKKVDFMMIDY